MPNKNDLLTIEDKAFRHMVVRGYPVVIARNQIITNYFGCKNSYDWSKQDVTHDVYV